MCLSYKYFLTFLFVIFVTTASFAESSKINSSRLEKSLNKINVEITTYLGDAQTFASGDQISFMLSLDQAAYVYLFYQDANNNILQLVPNKKQRSNYYQAGLFMPVPGQDADFKFTVRPPVGEEKLWVFATDNRVAEFVDDNETNELQKLAFSIDQLRSKIKQQAATGYGESVLTIYVAG